MWFIILALASGFLTCQCSSHDGISDKEHYKHDASHEHNPDYDHEAFLGKVDAQRYDEKSPVESKEKLGELFHKVDADGDGKVTLDEMMKWIQLKQTEVSKTDAAAEMKTIDANADGYMSWDEYMNKAFGFLDENGVPKANASDGDYNRYDPTLTTKEQNAAVVARDEGRFKVADVDGNKQLSTDEFIAFFHPGTADHMKPVVTQEVLNDLDKNHDGHVSLEEYIEDYWPATERLKDPKEPEWVKDERKKFTDKYDKNRDGKLDENEVKELIFPPEAAYVKEEANHLISSSDTNGDGKISKDEMLGKYDTFVGSHATNFGELLRDPEDL